MSPLDKPMYANSLKDFTGETLFPAEMSLWQDDCMPKFCINGVASPTIGGAG